MKFLINIFTACLIFTSCNSKGTPVKQERNEYASDQITSKVILGRMDESFLQQLKHRSANVDNLIVMSNGGKTSTALIIANEIYSHDLEISIAEICLSACAEYILPAASKINLIDEPLIGFHWNPIILGDLLKKNAEKDLEYCVDVGDAELIEFLNKTGKKVDAWKHTLRRLKLENYKVIYKKNECPWSQRKFANRFWFPTSYQLEEIFGLKVFGKLCADNPICYNKKIAHYFKKAGGSYIVGDAKITLTDLSNSE